MKKFAIWRKEGSGVGEQMRCAGVLCQLHNKEEEVLLLRCQV